MSDVSDPKPEDPTESQPTAPPPPAKRAWRERMRILATQRNTAVIGMAVVATLIVVVVFALSFWRSKPIPVAVDMSAITSRVDGLERRVAQVETASRQPVAAAVPAELNDRLTRLETALAALPKTEPSEADTAELANLRSRVDAATAMLTELTGRVDAVELRGSSGGTTTGTPPVDTGVLVTLRQTIAQLQQSLTDLTARVAAAEKSAGSFSTTEITALADRSTALEKRMGDLESKDVDTLTKRAATALAVANLVRATQGSGRFKTELGALAMIAPDDPALVKLTPYADKGLPSEPALTERFGHLIPDIIHAEDLAHDNWWFERMWTNFLSLITVRRIGEQPGNDARAVVGRAEQELSEHDLPGAVEEVKKLEPSAAEVARPWREAAEARVALDKLVNDINGRLLADIATEE